MASKFAETLQPTLRTNCAACHGVFQNPQFAVADPEEATQTIQANQLVDFDNPAGSRFVLKILSGHNGFPSTLATEVQNNIQAWADAINDPQADVDVTAPSIAIESPLASAVLSGTVNMSALASDDRGAVAVRFYQGNVQIGSEDTTAPYALTWNSSLVANGFYSLRAEARDGAGNLTMSATVPVEVRNSTTNPGDTVLPSVLISSHVTGSVVSGTVSVTANATDNTAVAGVQFLVNGAPLGTEDVSAPYAASWNTSSLTNGSYTFTARARDTAGNMSTSSGVVVNVQNAPPAVTYTYIRTNILPRCTSCHGASSQAGGISYSSYAGTMATVTANNPNASPFYTSTVNGSMPRGSTPLTAIQLQAIRDWITQGALNN